MKIRIKRKPTKRTGLFSAELPPIHPTPQFDASKRGADTGVSLPCYVTEKQQHMPKFEQAICAACSSCFMSMSSSLYRAAACSALVSDDHHATMARMPRLAHWPDRNLPFDYDRSEVIRFIMAHFGSGLVVAVGIFHLAANQGVILFDPASKTWAGVEGGAR
ncbi:MAG: hypothetical protein ACFUZC_07460 [Chthoniobacteraceae bacterium]